VWVLSVVHDSCNITILVTHSSFFTVCWTAVKTVTYVPPSPPNGDEAPLSARCLPWLESAKLVCSDHWLITFIRFGMVFTVRASI
jgi:hypothetical protein